MKYKLLILFFIFLFFSSCLAIIFDYVNVTCGKYHLTNELFWFQGDILTEYIFVNKSSNKERKFYLINRSISHIEDYMYLRNDNEEGGCGCHDISSQMLVGENDTIRIMNTSSTHSYNGESFTLKLGKTKDIITSETSVVNMSSIIVKGVEVKTKIFVSELGGIKTVLTIGQGIGPIKIEFYNGEIWERKEIKTDKIAPVKNYNYASIDCSDILENPTGADL
ncbi:hypothetical protein [uncultured Aquimarina sp.]|uniref:hypothetical protein n=1 Tax=uncultured Aquimarina sp. TaxID=575652 RepID=UPI002610FE94|nr:hypothetical protein [uncultured Aquimarina sp.]